MADLLDELKQEIRRTHRLIVESVNDLSDEQLSRRPADTTPSIAFHLWHSARWADNDQALIGARDEVWLAGGYAERWRLTNTALGEAGTGTGLSDDQSEALVLPGKFDLLQYVAAAFERLSNVLASLTADELSFQVTPPEGQQVRVQTLLFDQLTHAGRHLGMIEALKGLQGLNGTATR